MNKKVAIILVNYKDYARRFLADCVASIRSQDYDGERKIFLVDNESTDESYNYLKDQAAEAQIIRNKNNDGFAKGNNDAIKLALKQGFEYIILFNMDTVLEPSCIREMVAVAESDKKIGAVQARLMLYNNKNKINSLGNVTHFLGLGYSLGHNEEFSISNFQFSIKDICYPSGAAVLYTKEALEKVGLFDEEFWMYNEDQDLGWRIWLAGYRCVLAGRAVAYHKYEFSRSIKNYYWMDRNRIIAMLKNYHFYSLILIIPASIVMEMGLLFFTFKNGWFKGKMRVYKYFLSIKNWRYIMAERKKINSLRRAKDKDIIKLFSGRIWYQEIGEWKLKVANIMFGTYWKIIKILIRW